MEVVCEEVFVLFSQKLYFSYELEWQIHSGTLQILYLLERYKFYTVQKFVPNILPFPLHGTICTDKM